MSDTPQNGRRTAPTLEAVAAAAGVSKSTVSRVINGSNQVSPDAATAVEAAIERLNYVPNRAARSLVNSKTMALALVVPEDTTRFFGDPYFAAIVQGIARGLESSDYVLTLQLTSPSRPSQKTIRYLTGGNVDGAFVISHHSGDHFLTELGTSLPVVFGGRPLRSGPGSSYFVDVDNAAAAAMGTKHLIDIGRRNVAILAGPVDMPAGVDRTRGWRSALEAAGMPATRMAATTSSTDRSRVQASVIASSSSRKRTRSSALENRGSSASSLRPIVAAKDRHCASSMTATADQQSSPAQRYIPCGAALCEALPICSGSRPVAAYSTTAGPMKLMVDSTCERSIFIPSPVRRLCRNAASTANAA